MLVGAGLRSPFPSSVSATAASVERCWNWPRLPKVGRHWSCWEIRTFNLPIRSLLVATNRRCSFIRSMILIVGASPRRMLKAW